jgi:hypothetical protein
MLRKRVKRLESGDSGLVLSKMGETEIFSLSSHAISNFIKGSSLKSLCKSVDLLAGSKLNLHLIGQWLRKGERLPRLSHVFS